MKTPDEQLKNNALQRRLGDVLRAAELIDIEQLDEAIEYQCIYGGRLGTSLVELGYLSEEQLAQTLSQQMKLHYIKPDLLMNVPEDVLALVSEEIARTYQLVPYRKEGKRLFLAMREATNLAVIDDLSFQLGHIIIPLAIPEVRLMMALNKHYGIKLTPRFEDLSKQLARQAQEDSAARKQSPATDKHKASSKAETGPVDFSSLPGASEPADPILSRQATAHETGEHGVRNKEADAYIDEQTPTQTISYTGLCQQLAAATDRNDIARALINFLSQDIANCGILMVHDQEISGWLASSHGIEPEGFDKLSFSPAGQSVFNLVLDNRSPYLGPVSATPENERLLGFFQSSPPQEALILPILVRERLVSIIYLQDAKETLNSHFPTLLNIVKKAQMAFTLLILRNKILMT